MKYTLALLTGLLVWIISFLAMLPYLAFNPKFYEMQKIHNKWWEEFTEFIEDN